MFGISLDDVKTQAAFAKAQEVDFMLLSDPDGSAARKYGVFAGRFASRATFVIDETGKLLHIDNSVNVSSHGDDVVALVKKLQEG